MSAQPTHPPPTIYGVQQDRRHYEGTVFQYRGLTFTLTLTEFVDGSGGYVSASYLDPNSFTQHDIELGSEDDMPCWALDDVELASSGYGEIEFAPEFVSELCRRIDAALAKMHEPPRGSVKR